MKYLIDHKVKYSKNYQTDMVERSFTNSPNALSKAPTKDVILSDPNTDIYYPLTMAEDLHLDPTTTLKDELISADEFNIQWVSSDHNIIADYLDKFFLTKNRAIYASNGEMYGRIDVSRPCYADVTYRTKMRVGPNGETEYINIPMDYIDVIALPQDAGYIYQLWRKPDGSVEVGMYQTTSHHTSVFIKLGYVTPSVSSTPGYMTQLVNCPSYSDLNNKNAYLCVHTINPGSNKWSTHSWSIHTLSASAITSNVTRANSRADTTYPCNIVAGGKNGALSIILSERQWLNSWKLSTISIADTPQNSTTTVYDNITLNEGGPTLTPNTFFTYSHAWPHNRAAAFISAPSTILGISSDFKSREGGFGSIAPNASVCFSSIVDSTPPPFQTNQYANSKYRIVGLYIHQQSSGPKTYPILAEEKNGEFFVFVGSLSFNGVNLSGDLDTIVPHNTFGEVIKSPFMPSRAYRTSEGTLLSRPMCDRTNIHTVFIPIKKTLTPNRRIWAYNQYANRRNRSNEPDIHPYDIAETLIQYDTTEKKYYFMIYNTLITPQCKVNVHFREELNMDYEKLEKLEIEPVVVEVMKAIKVYCKNNISVRNIVADLEIII